MAKPQPYKFLEEDLGSPQSPQTDFKAALYLISCLHSYDFSARFHKPSFVAALQAVGYTEPVDSAKQADTVRGHLKEFVKQGLLLEFRGCFVRAKGVKEVEGTVKSLGDSQILEQGAASFKIFSYARNLCVIKGDAVKACICPLTGMAVVIEITKPVLKVFGLYGQEYGFSYITVQGERMRFVLDDKEVRRCKREFPNLRDNSLAAASIVERAEEGNTCRVSIDSVMDKVQSVQDAVTQAILTYNINPKFPELVSRQAKRVPTEVTPEDTQGRVDLRDLPLVTIDGEDARDFDDAVYVQKEGSDFVLYVAIADVSYYVRKGTLIDKEAAERTTSVYFPYCVIPMLPEQLSNGICSLNPKVDRLCFVCKLRIDGNSGKTLEYKFFAAVMNSHARLTYTEAYHMITKGQALDPEHEAVTGDVKRLYELYKILKKQRLQRGALNIEGEEVSFTFDENLQPDGIIPLERNDAHMLIEECMIAANVAAADFVLERKGDALLRVHDKPTLKKLGPFEDFIARRGITYAIPEEPTAKDFANLLDLVKDRADASIIGLMLLRTMSKAVYQRENIGHFGLALGRYAHFTSPIRRYPDLIIHRIIKSYLVKEGKAPAKIGEHHYSKAELDALGQRCTDKEIAASRAEFDVDNSLKCLCLQKYVGYTVQGIVSAVATFGVFITLKDFKVDGLLFVGDIDHGVRLEDFEMGELLPVKIAHVDPYARKITLLLAPEAMAQTKRSKRLVGMEADSPDFEIKFEGALDPEAKASLYENNRQALDELDRYRQSVYDEEPLVIKESDPVDTGLKPQIVTIGADRKESSGLKSRRSNKLTDAFEAVAVSDEDSGRPKKRSKAKSRPEPGESQEFYESKAQTPEQAEPVEEAQADPNEYPLQRFLQSYRGLSAVPKSSDASIIRYARPGAAEVPKTASKSKKKKRNKKKRSKR